eukprot:COSAG06_NODE_673_length_13189_cov_211.299312_4_plen_207_part_00
MRYNAYGSFLPAGLDLSKVHSWSIQDGTPLRYVEVEGGPEEEIQEEVLFDADFMISYKPAETIVAPFQKICECGDEDCRLPLSDIDPGVKITNLAEDPTRSSQPFTGTRTYSPNCEEYADMFSEDWIYDADAMFTDDHIKAYWALSKEEWVDKMIEDMDGHPYLHDEPRLRDLMRDRYLLLDKHFATAATKIQAAFRGFLSHHIYE